MRGGVEIGKKKNMVAKISRWGGDREDEEGEDGGEECEVG